MTRTRIAIAYMVTPEIRFGKREGADLSSLFTQFIMSADLIMIGDHLSPFPFHVIPR